MTLARDPFEDDDDWPDDFGAAPAAPEPHPEQREFAPQATDAPPEAIPLLDLSEWAARDPKAREWALDGWIPHRQATYLTGPGSAGKSLLAQQLSTCIAMGLPFLGVTTHQSKAIYITCEDDGDELERRQKAICEALGVDRKALAGNLFIASLHGNVDNELIRFDQNGRTTITGTYRSIEETVRQIGAGFIALDNVAHFTAEEINRSKVAGFVNLLNRLANESNGSVLFLGHPNKAGEQFSGSTAWENQVRSRLYLETPQTDGQAQDRDARVLSRSKANYAVNGEKIEFRWHHMAFVRNTELPSDYWERHAQSAEAASDNGVFLECLRKRTAKKLNSSASVGPNYAPSLFAKMPAGRNIGLKRMSYAMERLFEIDAIEVADLWKGKDRHWVSGLRETARETQRETVAGNAGNASAQSAGYSPPIVLRTITPGAAPPFDGGPQTSQDYHGPDVCHRCDGGGCPNCVEDW